MTMNASKSSKRKTADPGSTSRVARKKPQPKRRASVTAKPATKRTAASKSSANTSTLTIRFGSVTMQVKQPSRTKLKENVKAGTSALERVRSRLLRGGITIAPQRDIPLFRADPDVPNRLVRVLNGVTTYGTFVNGKFKPST